MSRKNGGDAGLTSFVGRRQDLAEGRRLLGNARLVTLVGPGGVGKTRLARRLSEDVARAFPDGTFLVELAELQDPDALAAELASSLGIDDVGHSHEATLAAFVRERRMLLVLDNCEHLVDATAPLAQTLLWESSGLRVIATSRQPLGVAGEQLMTVEPLSLPSPDARLGAEWSEAVELFVERARLVVPGFELTPDNAGLVGRVCTRLDGMPLAIELAAARLRVLSLAQLAERLNDRFGVLAVAATAALPRHQTLRASVDWSFDLCSPDEQTLWAWMSVFKGGCDLDAAEAVCAGTGINVFDTIAGLVDKSVLIPQEAAGRVRYRMLDTIRAYGREHLAERGDTAQLTQRHREYFVEFARSADMAWFGPDQRDLMAQTAAEYANLRAAFDACMASPATHQDALALGTSLWWFFVGQGMVDELSRWLRRALAVEQPATPLTLHATSRMTYFMAMRSDYVHLREYAERATGLVVDEDSAGVRWDRRWAQALLLAIAGDVKAAAQLNVETLGEEPPPGPRGLQDTVSVHMALAEHLFSSGDIERALDYLDKAIGICRRHGDQWNLSFLLCTRGARLADLGRPEEALATHRQALRLAQGFNSWTVVHALDYAAQTFALLGQGTNAAVLFGALTSLWPDVGGALMTSDPPHEGREQLARELLGDAAFETAAEQGKRMSVEAVVAFLLDEPEPAAAPRRASPGAAADLTKRELEVAELVARGLSNKEIAQALVLSPRTAEGHVARLLDKLGFESRARVAAWVAERRAGGH